ncbi:MaoC family dehydratase N-terminal domain-containing protein [Chloroflexota bacterium]
MTDGSVIFKEFKRKTVGWRFPQFPGEKVEMWAIRKYLEALADDNPLWQDEDYAKNTHWEGIIAPPTFVEVFNPIFQGKRRRVDQSKLFIRSPFPRNFLGNEEYEFFNPIRIGDTITSSGIINDVSEKLSSQGSRLIFVYLIKEYRNQREELVARNQWTYIYVEGYPQEPAAEPAVTPAPYKTGEIGIKPVCYEDIEVGVLLPSLVKQIDYVTITRWAAATSDYGLVHIDYTHAVEQLGLPSPVLYGQFSGASMAQLITDWIGDYGMLKRHSVEYRGNIRPGDTIIYQGEVTKKYRQGTEELVEVLTWAANQEGRKVAMGKSTVILKSGE